MSKVLVGLWSRNTHEKRNFSYETLIPLKKAVEATKLEADKLSSGKDDTVKSIFVAPEFLFTQPRKDNSGTTGMMKIRRDWILDHLKSMSSNCPGLLLVPGTIVFKEPITDASAKKVEPKLMHARDRAYPTKEVTDGKYKEFYEQQIAKIRLTLGEMNQVVTDPRVMRQSFLIKNRTFVFLNGQKIFSYGKKTNMGDFNADEAQGIYIPGKHQGVKKITEKLTVGFEVCWEHSLGILQQHLNGSVIDLHIIVSAEVPNEKSKFCVTKDGGFVIHASSNPDFSGVFKKVEGKGRMLEYREVRKDRKASDVLNNKRGKVDLAPAEEVVREFTGKGEDIDPETGKLEKRQWQVAAVLGRVDGWNAVKETKELTVGGSPLRIYEIDL